MGQWKTTAFDRTFAYWEGDEITRVSTGALVSVNQVLAAHGQSSDGVTVTWEAGEQEGESVAFIRRTKG